MPSSRRNAQGRTTGPLGHAAGRRWLAAVLATLVTSVAGATTARAAEGLYLTWSDCWLGGGTANRSFSCLSNLGESELVCAFTMPQAADNVVAIEIVIDLQHSAPTLPDWWQLAPGACRGDITQFSLVAATAFPGLTACVDMWQGVEPPPAVGEPVYITSEPRGQASQARIKVTAAVSSSDAVSLDATSPYYAARVILRHNLTTGNGSCAGCEQPACLVMNSILIQRNPGTPVYLQTAGPNDANWARWQGGAGANCAAVPVRNRAWGQLKGLYR